MDFYCEPPLAGAMPGATCESSSFPNSYRAPGAGESSP
jgi:hypothetical protein